MKACWSKENLFTDVRNDLELSHESVPGEGKRSKKRAASSNGQDLPFLERA